MRYALRNQSKIKQALSEDVLNRILLALNRYFSTHDEVITKREPGEPYEILTISDSGQNGGFISFYAVGNQYDVYRLAFKGFVDL